MKYVIRKRCAQKITTFYRNDSKKYKHTYSLELMVKNVNDAYDSIFQIEKTLQRREPTEHTGSGTMCIYIFSAKVQNKVDSEKKKVKNLTSAY